MILETMKQFIERTDIFIWNSMPEGQDLWVNEGAKQKVDEEGHYRPFFGDTVVFPLEGAMLDYVDRIQKKLDKIREEYREIPWEAYLADSLIKSTYHITLHDLNNGNDPEFVARKEKKSKETAIKLIEKLRQVDDSVIRMEPVCMFNMNGTSVVLGFRPVSEKDHNHLMELYEMFQQVVKLSYPLTPHVTLSYFRYGRHNSGKLDGLRKVMREVNEQIENDKAAGCSPVVELSVHRLAYQHFSSMNDYETIE